MGNFDKKIYLFLLYVLGILGFIPFIIIWTEPYFRVDHQGVMSSTYVLSMPIWFIVGFFLLQSKKKVHKVFGVIFIVLALAWISIFFNWLFFADKE